MVQYSRFLKELGEPSAWIFQGNPKYYDVIGAVEALDEITWAVNQYPKQIKKDDKAYIWVSGSDGGIIASGTILCDPEMRKPNLSDPYNRGDALKSAPYLAVDISIERKLTLEMTIGGNRISLKTLDLGMDWKAITAQLDSLCVWLRSA